ncbi:MAG TPA: hypothetical protein VIJ49_02755 [Aestuariivirga sp.]
MKKIGFVKAFSTLGYQLSNHQTDWSAESDRGVCITVWEKELGIRDGLSWFDSQVHAGPYEIWGSKVGNNKRKKHLARALAEFGGRVDVVIVKGTPGEGYDDADPWGEERKRKGHWQIKSFDQDTGHFSVGVVRG